MLSTLIRHLWNSCSHEVTDQTPQVAGAHRAHMNQVVEVHIDGGCKSMRSKTQTYSETATDKYDSNKNNEHI